MCQRGGAAVAVAVWLAVCWVQGLQPPQAGIAAPNAFGLCWGRNSTALGFLSACREAPWCKRGAEAGLRLLQPRAGFLWVLTDLQVQTRLLLLLEEICVQTAVSVLSGAGYRFLSLFVPREQRIIYTGTEPHLSPDQRFCV